MPSRLHSTPAPAKRPLLTDLTEPVGSGKKFKWDVPKPANTGGYYGAVHEAPLGVPMFDEEVSGYVRCLLFLGLVVGGGVYAYSVATALPPSPPPPICTVI